MQKTPFTNSDVIAVFEEYPPTAQYHLLYLRQLIFDVAKETEGVGKIEETLKWGQLSYLTPVTKSGSTIRIDASKTNPEQFAIYVNCQTTLVETFRSLYSDQLEFEGDRCIQFDSGANIPEEALKHCIALTLTYHLNKKKRNSSVQ